MLQNWDLERSVDGGASYTDVAIDLPADTLSYDWTVPDVECTACVLRVTMDNAGTDYSAELSFTVVAATVTDAGTDAGGSDAGADAGAAPTSDAGSGATTGGGCSAATASPIAVSWPLGVALIGLWAWRRRR